VPDTVGKKSSLSKNENGPFFSIGYPVKIPVNPENRNA